MPPPMTFRYLRARAMSAFEPMSTDPTGAPNPLINKLKWCQKWSDIMWIIIGFHQNVEDSSTVEMKF